MQRTIAIDFDGTLFENNWPGIGPPNMNVIRSALAEKQSGSALILWTCREGDMLDAAIRACESVGLTFDAVNESTEEWKRIWGNNPRKVGASEYWDDKSVNPLFDTRFKYENQKRQSLTRGVSRRGDTKNETD